MKDRIREVMENQHMTQKVFAKFVGISESTLSSVFNGKTKPTLQMVDAIHQHLPKVSTEWMLWGTGSMYLDDAKAAGSAASSQGSSSSDAAAGGLAGSSSSPAPSLFSAIRDAEDNGVGQTPKNIQQTVVKYIDKPQRKITEIRVFFDDQTWETFVPSK